MNSCSGLVWEQPAWPALGPDRSIRKAVGNLIWDTHRVENGYMYVPQTPGLGREIDWQGIADRTVATI